MAYDVAAAHRIRAAVEKSKAIFMPAFRHRFLPAIVALKNLLATGKIGDIVFFNNMFCGPAFAMEQRWFTKKSIAGGGCILDTSSHSVDLFRFLVGEIVSQNAVMHRHFKTTDVEDAGILSVKAVSGAVGAMESGFVAGCGMAFIDIMGTKGQIRYDYIDPEKLLYRLTQDKEWTVQTVEKSWGFAEEISHFVGAIKGEHPLACTVNDGVRCMEVISSVYPY
jgi:predicted dehydrogenase